MISLVTPSFIKIKYKPEDNILIETNFGKSNSSLKKKSLYGVDNGEDDEEGNTIVRDSETLNQEKLKLKNAAIEKFNEFNKMRNKLNKNKTGVKYTDSDEEIINEVELYKEQIGAEIKDDLADKRQAFLKMAAQQKLNNEKESELGKVQSGLIMPKKEVREKSYFSEIVENLNTTYEPDKYGQLNKLMNKKMEEKKDNKIQKIIDYSQGGLQTFKKQEEVKVEIQNEDDEEIEFNDDDTFTNKKRNRIVIEPKSKLVQPKQYSAMRKPPNRNEYDNNDLYDYDAMNIPGENSNFQYHDLSTKKYNKTDSKSRNLYEY